MLEMVLAKLEELKDSVRYSMKGSVMEITALDYDEDYDDEAVDAFTDWLEEMCVSHDGDLYHYFDFDEFVICFGYSAYEE